MVSLMMLPNELLLDIVDQLGHDDLKSLRIVNKRFADLGAPSLFETASLLGHCDCRAWDWRNRVSRLQEPKVDRDLSPVEAIGGCIRRLKICSYCIADRPAQRRKCPATSFCSGLNIKEVLKRMKKLESVYLAIPGSLGLLVYNEHHRQAYRAFLTQLCSYAEGIRLSLEMRSPVPNLELLPWTRNVEELEISLPLEMSSYFGFTRSAGLIGDCITVNHNTIKSLALKVRGPPLVYGPVEFEDVISHIKRWPSGLERLTIGGFKCSGMEATLSTWKNLQYLEINGHYDISRHLYVDEHQLRFDDLDEPLWPLLVQAAIFPPSLNVGVDAVSGMAEFLDYLSCYEGKLKSLRMVVGCHNWDWNYASRIRHEGERFWLETLPILSPFLEELSVTAVVHYWKPYFPDFNHLRSLWTFAAAGVRNASYDFKKLRKLEALLDWREDGSSHAGPVSKLAKDAPYLVGMSFHVIYSEKHPFRRPKGPREILGDLVHHDAVPTSCRKLKIFLIADADPASRLGRTAQYPRLTGSYHRFSFKSRASYTRNNQGEFEVEWENSPEGVHRKVLQELLEEDFDLHKTVRILEGRWSDR